MSGKRMWLGLGCLGLLLALTSLTLLIVHYASLPERINQMETIVLGQSRYVPGSQAALRVVVRDVSDQAPIANAAVKVLMQAADGGDPISLFEGRTDALGVAGVSFTVPRDVDPAQNLIVESTSSLGEDRLQQSITVERDYKILLTTDKPLYQPGQVMHLRALALSTFDRTPASGKAIEFTIADGKGNKVFRDSITASPFGVAPIDFQLASEVNTGAYKISAQMGNTVSEKTVTVERYVLPKFKVSLLPERSYYLPGERVRGSLDAAYFFGKKVSAAEVLLEGFTFDFERQVWFTLEGKTDEQGQFEFEFDLPEYIVGTEFEGGAGRFYLQASVTDQAQHTEQSSLSLPVSQSRLIIEAVPESGTIRAGVENILFVLTSYPDGTPAETRLEILIDGKSSTLRTGTYGLAAYSFEPASNWLELHIQARDEMGNTGEQSFYFEGAWQQETVLLRPDRAVYHIGETMQLDVRTSVASGTAYLDIVREGQTVSTRTVQIENGLGQVAVDLTPDLYGTLELHAYKILSTGHVVRDTRLVVVDSPTDLMINITADKDEYRPGDVASLDFEIRGQDGVGAQSALGLAIVDESVFALAEQDPGFAKLYFMLEAELLQPKYDIHGFSVPDLVGPLQEDPELYNAVEGAAKASMAETAARAAAFGLNLNSHDEKIQLAETRRQTFFGGLARVLHGLALLLPLSIMGITILGLRREQILAKSLLVLLLLLTVLALIILLWPVPEWTRGSPLERLAYLLDRLIYGLQGLLLVLLLAGLVTFIALTLYAWRRPDRPLRWVLLLSVVFIPILGGTLVAAAIADLNPGESIVLWSLLLFMLIPITYLLRAAGFGIQRKLGWSGAAFLTAFFIIAASLVVPMFSMMGAMSPAIGNMRGGVLVEEAFEAEGLGAPMAAADVDMQKSGEAPGAAPGEPPRLRQFFPETMLWLPEVVSDPNGDLQLDIDIADSITTWRLTALASTQDGRLGATTSGLRVFQDFFIDLDLPVALTQNDEIAVPVGVFNYLPEAQTVQLEVTQEGWFELLDEPVKEMMIASNDIDVVYFRIKAVDFGLQAFQVTARGSRMSDAIRKELRVYPDGKAVNYSLSDRLGQEAVQQRVTIPSAAIPGTQSLAVKIYPGVISQIVEGLDSILRMPFGCFEQTSSTTYPNVLVLDYLISTNQASPETQFKAEEYINLGYQRLTTFEVNGGGFSLFGDAPADRMLTAYGLQEFADMRRVHNVDPALIERAAQWLLDQQDSDGSWKNDRGLVHEDSWTKLENDRVPVTAYVAWSLIEAGFGDDGRTQEGLAYIREHLAQADDPYVVALVANALVAAEHESGSFSSFTSSTLDKLASMAQSDGQSAFWTSSVATFMGSEGQTGSIETTALAAFALLRADSHPELANGALTYLVRQKDSFGTWYNTQATVLSLKALLESVRSGAENVNASVTISLNGGQTKTIAVTPENFDVVQVVHFDDVSPGVENTVAITLQGEGNLMYQIYGAYFLPWREVAAQQVEPGSDLISIDLAYDRTELSVNDTLQVDVTVTLHTPGTVEWALIDLGIPPGFSINSEDLSSLVARFEDVPEDYAFPTVERYELTGRQILVYIGNLSYDYPLAFSYRLRAKFPLTAQTPASNAYDYYNPGLYGEAEPITLTVRQ